KSSFRLTSSSAVLREFFSSAYSILTQACVVVLLRIVCAINSMELAYFRLWLYGFLCAGVCCRVGAQQPEIPTLAVGESFVGSPGTFCLCGCCCQCTEKNKYTH